jgi:uncharacterized protein
VRLINQEKIDKMLNKKLENLDNILKELRSFIVAYSGGVDSTFLLYRASQIKKLKIAAVTIRTTYIPKREIEEAAEFCKSNEIKHIILDLPFSDEVKYNPIDRCYVCKKLLFAQLRTFADKNGYLNIVDGSNSDDNGDFRPGLKALKELGIRSPLMESGLIKHEIRELSQRDELPTWISLHMHVFSREYHTIQKSQRTISEWLKMLNNSFSIKDIRGQG